MCENHKKYVFGEKKTGNMVGNFGAVQGANKNIYHEKSSA